MMDCLWGTIGLLAMACTTLLACGVALALAFLPQAREHRRTHERAAFLRTQLLNHLHILPQFLQERDRPLPLEHRDVLDDYGCLALHASLLEMDEWTSVLRIHAMLMTARNRPSFTKREARRAQQSIDQAAAALRSYADDELDQDVWWKNLLPSRRTRPTAIGPAMDKPATLHNTGG